MENVLSLTAISLNHVLKFQICIFFFHFCLNFFFKFHSIFFLFKWFLIETFENFIDAVVSSMSLKTDLQIF